jgi:hypothetical protein
MAKEERCGLCLYWEHRAEAEVDEHTGYCSVHEMMKQDSSVCPKFKRRTPEAVQKYYDELYGDAMEAREGDLGPDVSPPNEADLFKF